MLRIDRLRLELPAGFEGRAEGLARQIGEELAALPAGRAQRLEHLRLEPITAEPGAGDSQIAGRIARAIQRRLESTNGG